METNKRKHFTQMSAQEKSTIETFLHTLTNWQGFNHPHVLDRKSKWSVNDTDIIEALQHGVLIEANANNAPDIRFVIRYAQGNRAVCICVSHRGRIITLWVNGVNDTHFTLDRSQYQWKVNLETVFNTVCRMRG